MNESQDELTGRLNKVDYLLNKLRERVELLENRNLTVGRALTGHARAINKLRGYADDDPRAEEP
ncbi:MAG: hypothetical protein GY906_07835 [bacterium]|nr:hypothetical protein [bacterium]